MENITQVKTLDGRVITSIEIGKFLKGQAERIKTVLNGKTFMNFEIIVAPIGGMFQVSAETAYKASEAEIMGMFISMMASEL